MKNICYFFIFTILNFIIIFNIFSMLAAFIGGLVGFLYATMSPYDSGFAMLIPIFICASLAYFLVLPTKFVFYPILYEYSSPSNIIHKLFEKIRTSKLTTAIVLVFAIIIDILVYLFTPDSLISLLDSDFVSIYKKSQLIGLTCCVLTLLLWFKIRKPEHNGKRLFLFYIALTIIFSVISFLFIKSNINL